MNHKSRTLRRLGIAGVGAVIAIGTPAVGLTGVASASPATVTLYSQHNNAASTLNDGTGTGPSSIKLSAVQNTKQTASDPAIASMRFTYAEISPTPGPTTPIATDNSYPFSVNWTPPSNGSFTVTAEPLATGGGSGGTSDSRTVTVNNVDPSVHITSPTDGAGPLPFTTTGSTDYVGVTGTRSNNVSTGLPAISFNTRLYDETTGALINDEVSTDAVVPAEGPTSNPDQTWNTAVEIPDVSADCGTDVCDVLIDAVAGPTANSGADEVVQTKLATSPQTLNVGTFTVTPTGTGVDNEVDGTTGNPTVFVATAKDNNGAPMAGVKVVAETTDPPGSTTFNNNPPPQTLLTDASGKATFSVKDTAAETQTLTFRTEVNGSSTVGGNDFTVTRKYVTSAATITTITVTKTPEQSTYATQGYDQDHPEIVACLFDQNGDPFTGSNSGVSIQVRRSITGGGNPILDGQFDGPAPVDPDNNCYHVDLSDSGSNVYPNDDQSGSDAYDVFVDHNSTPGFQPGSSDVGATTTVNFAPGAFKFDHYADCTQPGSSCKTQAQTGVSDTITATESIGGSPVPAGRTLDLELISSSADFPAAQPSGTNRVDDSDATCTTDASGSCQVNVSDSTAETADLDVSEPGGSFTGRIAITFYNHSVAFNKSDLAHHTVLYPCADDSDSPLDSDTTCTEGFGAPGTILVGSYNVRDSSGDALADVPVTLTVDHGYFTPRPSDFSDYDAYTFNPAAASGGLAGAPQSVGQSINLITDENGRVHYAMSIGRDSSFDDNGRVTTTLKVNNVTPLRSNGGPVDGNPAGSSVEGYTWTTNVNDLVGHSSGGDELGDIVTGGALNGASVTMMPYPGSTLTGTHTSQFNPAGDVINEGVHASVFFAEAKDQFGNLVGTDTSVTGSGPGLGQFGCPPNHQPNDDANNDFLFTSYTDDVSNGNQPVCALDITNSTPTTPAAFTVTDTWDTQTTTFVPDDDATPGSDPFIAVVNHGLVDDPTKSNSFSMQLYIPDLNHLHFAYHVFPHRIVATGTTVHDEVTVTDQQGHPVSSLFVSSDQSGPGNRDFTDGTFTNQVGTGSYNFSSAQQGIATVTTDVYDCDISEEGCSDLPLSEKVNQIAFDGVPTINITQSHHGHRVTIFGKTRKGALVQLFERVGHGKTHAVGSKQKAANDGSYSFSRHIRKTTSFAVSVDGTVNSSAILKAHVAKPHHHKKKHHKKH